jgi:cyclophilin family peptidyl-prolyl cis-trans isomerase
MNQKHVFILFVAIVLIGISGTVANKVKENAITTPSPTPSTNSLLFNSGQNSNTGGTQNIITPTPQPGKNIKQYPKFPGVLSATQLKGKKAVIETDKGKIEFEIYPEATKSASNFIYLAKDGFYNSLTFHRVEPGFVVQGGDPLGNGAGNPGYQFEDDPVTKTYAKGIVAMANSGPNTNGCQFFIMLADHPELPPKYSIFGKVISGQDVVDKLAVGDIMKKVSIQSLAVPAPTNP